MPYFSKDEIKYLTLLRNACENNTYIRVTHVPFVRLILAKYVESKNLCKEQFVRITEKGKEVLEFYDRIKQNKSNPKHGKKCE